MTTPAVISPFFAFVVLLLATLASIELVWSTRALPHFAGLGAESRRAAHILARRRVSEWAKERALRFMSARLMLHSLRGLVLISVITSPFILIFVANVLHPFGLARVYASWPDRLVLLLISVAWVLFRRHLRKTRAGTDATRADGTAGRLLQRLALGSRPFLDMSFDIERARFMPWKDGLDVEAEDAPIFVTGLARAGTTILTRLLHEQYGMASLTYRDLPFPLAPNSWAALSARFTRHVERAERGHGDGIFHDLDSAEAIEEVFWRFMEGARTIRQEGLAPVIPENTTINAFRDYVGLVRRRYGGGRYLSKNNANILRLAALVEAFPSAVVVHPFRDPLQHAQSLRRQHALALRLAAEDPFRRDFTRWMGHYEFGPDQRPFLFPGHPDQNVDKMAIDYWLQLWICVYTALLNQPHEVRARQVFVDYDATCADPHGMADPLADALSLSAPCDFSSLRRIAFRTVEGANSALVTQAGEVHAALVARALGTRHHVSSIGAGPRGSGA